MTDCFRLAVQKELAERLVAEVPALSGAFFRGRFAFGENDPLPCGSLLEDPREFPVSQGGDGAGSRRSDWRLLLQGWVQDDPVNPTDPAHQLAADYQRALAKIRSDIRDDATSVLSPERKTNVIMSISIGAPIVRPPDEFSSRAYCWLPLTLVLVEDPQRPFT